METACLRHTELPNASRLFTDFLYHYDRVERFYELQGTAGDYPQERREALVSALREQNPGNPALEVLAKPGTVAYVTGQQVGLFSGPAYTIYKALTAIRLAAESTKEGKPAVAIFWLATEDHDFAEVNHAWAFDAAMKPVQFQVDGHMGLEQPVGDISIPAWPVKELRAVLTGLPFADDVIKLVEESYLPGETMGGAFRSLIQKILGRFGLLFIDPLKPAIRQLAAPFLQNAIEMAPELTNLLLARNKELEEAGYHAQVHIEAKTSLFFLLDKGRRVALRRGEGQYTAKDRKYSRDDLKALADHISPNALLRPVLQDYMIPTAAYIGGPAELAYFAQSQVIYKTLLGYMPRLVSRSGFTLFDARTAKLMDRYSLQLKDLFHGEAEFRERLAARLVPPELAQQFTQTQSDTADLLQKLQQSVKTFDPTLGDALAKSQAKMMYQLSKSEAKVARETLRRNARAAADAEYLYSALMPHKHLQERFYSFLPFLAQIGPGLIDRVYDHVKLDCPDHILLTV
ncbi:MAG: bacillithiol biosynthesis cysteine-adding enzyme BshC [Bryobacteraceae bacterium]